MRNPDDCDHESVRIRRIVFARDTRKRSRTIGGECERCGGTVVRVQTEFELANGIPETWWSDGLGFHEPS
jgi:hypothetical protein